MQRNWIGRSEGANVIFKIDGHAGSTLEIYTTRPDTLFGTTYMVLAPEHPLAEKITTAEQKSKVAGYLEAAAKKSDLERTDLAKEKTGVFSGAYAINPVNEQKIPIWIADYVLISYGTGAIMAVPAHDERDWEFAKVFDLPAIQVVADKRDAGNTAEPAECTTADGFSINSGILNGLPTKKKKKRITEWLEEKGLGKQAVNFKLRDWLFSRQRYWGEPIPVVHCKNCAANDNPAAGLNAGIVPLNEKDLPLKLPDVQSYAPTGTGESPLAAIDEWVNTTCPGCGGPARRETNTMPQWAGSCWYYLRYLDPQNSECFAGRDKIDYWAPVDLYVGGVEHAVLHLLYARFWHKVLYDFGLVNTKEPFQRLVNQGMITSFAYQRKDKTLVPADQVEKQSGGHFTEKATGEEVTEVIAKMSKSLKNIINPDEIVRDYGADSLRVYEMFMGPLEVSKPWNTAGLIGVTRFLERIWSLSEKVSSTADSVTDECKRLLHKTVKKVSGDTATLNFNTAISAMMIYSNGLAKLDNIPVPLWEPLVKMLSCYAPHLGEELWEKLGRKTSVSKEVWPEWDEQFCAESEVTIVVQINGKIRDKFTAPAGSAKEELEKQARALPNVQKWLEGCTVLKTITVPDKLVNIVSR
jgi:leucyl-tRNA synthetase